MKPTIELTSPALFSNKITPKVSPEKEIKMEEKETKVLKVSEIKKDDE